MAEVAEETSTQSVGSRTHSRENSDDSDWWRAEDDNKENTRQNSSPHQRQADENSNDSRESEKMVLHDGERLREESRTEMAGLLNNCGFSSSSGTRNGETNGFTQVPEYTQRRHSSGGGTGTARQRAIKSGNMVYPVPEVEIHIPSDGNLASFSPDAMATFLRQLRLEDRVIGHLHRSGLDGRRFGHLKDSDLDTLKLNNPVLVYFRDRTAPAVTKKAKSRVPFVL